jgi:phage baseplate assembly protein W
MADIRADRTFLGTGWKFPPEFQRLGKQAAMVSAEPDIRESLRILLSTVPGERLMHPTYGCGLKQMVFERIDGSTVTQIRDRIERAILFFEPRIDVNRVTVAPADPLEGVLRIEIEYTVRATNSRNNIVFPFHVREGTGIDTSLREHPPVD